MEQVATEKRKGRKYLRETVVNAATGLTEVVSTISEEGGEPREMAYVTYGTRAESAMQYAADVVRTMVAVRGREAVVALIDASIAERLIPTAEEGAERIGNGYSSWTYGEDLKERQRQKAGGTLDPWVSIGKTEECNLVSGAVRLKANKAAVDGKVIPLDMRVDYIADALRAARFAGKDAPRAISEAFRQLEEAGQAQMDGGRPVVVKAAPEPAKTGGKPNGKR